MEGTCGQSVQRKLSLRLLRKGALIEETYAAMEQWDLSLSVQENLRRLRDMNIFGAKNAGWLYEIVATLSSRFVGDIQLEALVFLVQRRFPLEKWKSCLLWHVGKVDELYYRFATEWLFEEYKAGTFQIKTEAVLPFVHKATDGRIASGGNLSEYSIVRTARDLLLMATDFGLLSGGSLRQLLSYHLSDESFLYLLHALAEHTPNAHQIVHSPDWRLFLMAPEDVERELFRLHQYRKLHYDVAGSLAQLTLPHRSVADYARELAL